MGETITHETVTTHTNGLVHAVACRVHHVLSNGRSEENLLCDYIDDDSKWHSITSTDMRTTIRETVVQLKLQENKLNTDLVGVHSLHAGAAMALKLQGINDTTINKQGQWTSMTFLQYIHNQIAHLTKDLSTKMSTILIYQNVATIKVTP